MRCEEGADPYQLRVGELGRFDVVHLGLGPDGHTASLFPGSAALDADPGRLVVMNDDPLGAQPAPPHDAHLRAASPGPASCSSPCTGEEKREALARVAAGDGRAGGPRSTPSGWSGWPTRRRPATSPSDD